MQPSNEQKFRAYYSVKFPPRKKQKGQAGIKLNSGKLADLAPTILKIMNLVIPKEMTGEILV